MKKTVRQPATNGGRISRPTLMLILAGVIMAWGMVMVVL